MSTSPPYHNIDPARAAEKLGEPADVKRFAYASALCAKGREDLARRGYAPDGRKRLRRFSVWEITRYLIPVAPAHLRRVLGANPHLPQGVSETQSGARSGTRWFTLEEILILRTHFADEGARSKEYTPYRPPGAPAKIIAVANFKGGVGKTSTAAHLAMSAALDGYKVLVIDLDSQGSMTSIFSGVVEDEWKTAFALMACDFAREIVAERGEEGLDETLTEALRVRAQDVIQPTHWPNIDLIGAQLNLYWAEFQIPVWRMTLRRWRLWDVLTRFLEQDGLLQRYDVIVLDTPPALGYLTINALAAADILIVPLGASFLEFESTGRFFDMLYSTFASIEDGENDANRALGLPEVRFEWDAVRAVITRYDPSQQADLANVIQAYIGEFTTAHRQEFTALVGQAGEQVNGIYEADHRGFNRETYLRGRETFDRTYADVKELLQGCWWRDARRAEAEAKAQPPTAAAAENGAENGAEIKTATGAAHGAA